MTALYLRGIPAIKHSSIEFYQMGLERRDRKKNGEEKMGAGACVSAIGLTN